MNNLKNIENMKHSYVRATLNQETNAIRMISARAMAVAATTKRVAMTLLLAVLTTATAWAATSGDWTYQPNSTSTECIITGYTGNTSVTSIKIPKTLGGMPVISFSTGVFSACTNLRMFVFYEDAQIKYMPVIPIPENFWGVDLINDSEEKVAENTLPASITSLNNEFRGTAITTLTMPGVTSIGDRAFEGCNDLTSVTFGQAATIGTYAFQKINNMKNGGTKTVINYPGPMSNWSCYNYQYSPNLIVEGTYKVNNVEEKWYCGWCGDAWSSGADYQSVSSLYWTLDSDGNMVIDCVPWDQTYDDLSNQVIKTQNWLSYKDNVTSLTLNHVYALSDKEFDYNFPILTSITFSEGLISIGKRAFAACPITSLTIPSTVTNIRENAFASCSDVASITVHRNNTTYDSRGNCNAIIHTATNTLMTGCKNTVIPTTVTSIGRYAFYALKSLTSVSLPAGVTSIGYSAFYSCKNLATVTIPASVTSIDGWAFIYCSSLTDFYFDGTKTQWDAVTKGESWNHSVASGYTEHWRCGVTYDANGHGTAPAAQSGLWSNEAKVTRPADLSADGWWFLGWFTDADCTTPWNFNDAVPGDMTLYAGWGEPCAATFTTDATSIEIPYGQEWTDIPVTVSSLNLGWFQNEGKPARLADAVAATPFVGSGAGSGITFINTSGGDNFYAYKGAGAHTVGNRVSEAMTAVGQSGKLWIHIPQEVWESAAPGDYIQYLPYDAVFTCNSVNPAETYNYSLGSDARVAISLTVPERLYDNSNNSTAIASMLSDVEQHNLVLQGRTLYRDGYWNTLCLPFAVGSFTGTPLEGATVMELDMDETYDGHKTGLDGTTLYLYFKTAQSIEAGKPYIVKWATPAANITNPVFSYVNVTAIQPTDVSFTGGKFCGTYDPTVIYNAEHNKYYLGDDNKLCWPETEGYSVKAFRAYFDLSPAPAGVRDFVLNFDGEENTTEIISTTNYTNFTNSDNSWYSLDGRKLAKKPTAKGLYIHNGIKVVIK